MQSSVLRKFVSDHFLIFFLLAVLAYVVGNRFPESIFLSLLTTACSVPVNLLIGQTPLANVTSSFLGRLAFGLALGTSGPALMGLVLQVVGCERINPFPAFLLIVLATWTLMRRRMRPIEPEVAENVFIDDRFQFLSWMTVVVGTLVFLAGWSSRAYGVILASIVAVVGMWKIGSIGLRWGTFGLGAVIAFASRAPILMGHKLISNDWISSDVLWDEAQATGFVRTIAADSLFHGESLHHYFLANYWSGISAAFVRAEPIAVSGRFGIVVGVVMVVSVSCLAASHFFMNSSAGFAAVVLVVAQAGFPEERLLIESLRVPNLLPLGWLMLCSFLILYNRKMGIVDTVLALGLGLAIVLAKTPYIAVPIVLLLVSGFGQMKWDTSIGLWNSIAKFNRFASAIVLAVVAVFMYGWMGKHTGQNTFVIPSGFVLDLAAMYMLRLLGPLAVPRGSLFAKSRIWVILFALLIFFTYSNEGTYHILSAAIAVNGMLVSSVLGQQFSDYRPRAVLVVPLLVGVCLAAGHWAVHIHAVRSFGLISKLYDGKELLYWIGAALLIWLGSSLICRVQIPYLLVVSTLSVGLFIGHSTQNFLENRLYGVPYGQGVMGDLDRVSVAEYLRKSLPEGSIVASNTVCQANVTTGSATPSFDVACRRRNEDAWLVALSGHSAFFEAPRWSSAGESLDEEAADRYMIVTSFANFGSRKDARIMELAGVTHFVIDLDNVVQKWNYCDSTVFLNSRYRVLEIDRLYTDFRCN